MTDVDKVVCSPNMTDAGVTGPAGLLNAIYRGVLMVITSCADDIDAMEIFHRLEFIPAINLRIASLGCLSNIRNAFSFQPRAFLGCSGQFQSWLCGGYYQILEAAAHQCKLQACQQVNFWLFCDGDRG